VRDPGAWGCANPEILVLGISKGFTQANAYTTGNFDDVAFKDCRDRLTKSLNAVRLVPDRFDIDTAMTAAETKFGWGSLVRCSLSGWNTKAKDYRAGTKDVLPAFGHTDTLPFIRNCVREHLYALPRETELVVLLGNDNSYLKRIRELLKNIFGSDYETIYTSSKRMSVAHRIQKRLWVHAGHPSPVNGWLDQFADGDRTSPQGLKRELV
jgi:hypothetical protein